MRRLRICQLITELAPAGAERSVYELASRLDARRFDVQVASLRGGAVADALTEAGVRVTVLGVRGRWDVMKVGKLVDLLRRERIDVLHTHLFHADLVGRTAGWVAGVRYLVHTVHTTEARFRAWQFAAARFAAGRYDHIIAVSESVRRHHARRSGLPLNRYVVIPNGVDPDAYARDDQRRLQLRGQWGIAPEEILVAFVGRLDEEKGLETLLGAMRLLERRGAASKLVIAGDGPRRKLVEQFITGDLAGGMVMWVGFVTDVRGVLSAADIFAMPSRWEGFGLAAAEAMAASLPVIATRIPGLTDVVVDGQTALLIEKDDAAGLADAVERLSQSAELREHLGQTGRRRVIEHFGIAASIAAHERIYLEIAGDLLTA